MNKITFWSSIAAVSIAASLVAVGQAHAADGVPAITAGTSGLPRMDVVDVSSNNGTISVADYKKMQNYGVKAVIVKLSEADSYKNPYAKSQILMLKKLAYKLAHIIIHGTLQKLTRKLKQSILLIMQPH